MENNMANLAADKPSLHKIDYKSAIQEIFVEIDRFDEKIKSNQEETARLQLETREMLTQMKAA